jgi:hypothetical protein
MKMGMRFSTVLALTGIACICGVSKPGIAGVSFSDIATIPGVGNFTLLDNANLPGKGHFDGLTFQDSTFLAFDRRFTQDGVGIVSESTDPTDNRLGFTLDNPQTTVILDVVTTTPGQTLWVQWQTEEGSFKFEMFDSNLFPTGVITIPPAGTVVNRIKQVTLMGSLPGAFGVDCIVFFPDNFTQCPNVPIPPRPRPPLGGTAEPAVSIFDRIGVERDVRDK